MYPSRQTNDKKNRPKENSLRREKYITRGTTQIALRSASQAHLSSLMLLRSHTGEFYGLKPSSLRLGSYRPFPFTNGSHLPPSLLRLSEKSLFVIAFITGILSSKFLIVNKNLLQPREEELHRYLHRCFLHRFPPKVLPF